MQLTGVVRADEQHTAGVVRVLLDAEGVRARAAPPEEGRGAALRARDLALRTRAHLVARLGEALPLHVHLAVRVHAGGQRRASRRRDAGGGCRGPGGRGRRRGGRQRRAGGRRVGRRGVHVDAGRLQVVVVVHGDVVQAPLPRGPSLDLGPERRGLRVPVAVDVSQGNVAVVVRHGGEVDSPSPPRALGRRRRRLHPRPRAAQRTRRRGHICGQNRVSMRKLSVKGATTQGSLCTQDRAGTPRVG